MDRVVVALGGNALLRRGEEDTFENMYRSARLAAERVADIAAAGWVVKPDAHGGYRRVVPSPTPYSIVEAPVIRSLVADGVIVIAAGGGGVPVTEQGPRLIGVEGVVDKDLAAAILARDVQASTLLILTDVRRVQRGFGTENATDIDRLTVAEARELLAAREFGAGSMGPKITAGIEFVEGGGIRAAIGDLDDSVAVLDGSAGTTIVAS